MTDNRFKDFPIDARFPSPGVDFRFAELGVDARFRDGLDTRFQGDTYGAFNPRTLFGPTDTGWVYDLSDMSTLFQDAAGVTPVTDVNQPVGLVLDKSKGLVLGPELVTNGTFDTDTAWTKGTGWTISGGVASFTATGATSNLSQVGVVTIGRSYRISVSVTRSAGQVRVLVGNSAATPWYTAAGTYTALVAAAGSTEIIIQADAAFVGTIDNISVRELPGNHRSQSASLPRPTYARHPLGGIRNRLTFTEQFDNADWSKVSSTITANAGVAPNGTTTADNWFFNSGVSLVTTANGLFTSTTAYLATTNPVLLSATAHTYSLYVKAGSGLSHIQLRASTASNLQAVSYTAIVRLSDGAVVAQSGSTCLVSSAGNGWWRIAMTFTPTANLHFFGVWGWNDTSITTNGTQFYTLRGAQLEPGSTATPYQRVVSVFDVTEAGVPDLYYLSYDGLNDSLSTAPFAWGTDKATVVAGVRKLSDAAAGTVAEMSVAADGNSGAFFLRAPTGSLPNYQFLSRGTSTSATAPSPYAAPITHVLSCLADISGDTNRFRINGTQVASNLADQGTGNFGTHPVFFGSRAGTSLFFNGREYSQFAINRLLTANELSQIERYTAQRTGVTIP